MSLGNKYLDNTIRARYANETSDATPSSGANSLLLSYEQQGYKIINTKDFYPNTSSGVKYTCYDAASLKNYLLYQDTFFQIAVEKYDSTQKTYKAIVRHFLLKQDGSLYIKQIVFAYPRSIFTLSDQDRANYTKTLLALPSYNDFNTYYSSIYALKTSWPSLPIPCSLGIGSGCFVSELNFYMQKYNEESDFGSSTYVPSVANDRQDLINGFYYLTGQDISKIGYPVSSNYIYNSKLYNKPYSTGSASDLQGGFLNYIAGNEIIRDNQTVYDTQSLSEGDPRREPNSVTQENQNNNQNNNQVSTEVQGGETFIGSSYSDIPAQYGNPNIFDGISPEDLGYYQGDITPAGLEIYKQLCPPGFAKQDTDQDGNTTVGSSSCKCNST